MAAPLSIPFGCHLNIVKADDDKPTGKWIIEGFASISNVVDRQNDFITDQAISHSAKQLIGMTTLLNHDVSKPIGRVIHSEARPQGLFVRAEISKSEPDVWAKLQDRTLSKFSIRGRIIEAFTRFVEELQESVLFINKMDLVEVSVVSVPANPKAEITDVLLVETRKAVDAFCKSGGTLPRYGTTRQQQKGGGDSGMLTVEQELELLEKAMNETDTDKRNAILKSLQDGKAEHPDEAMRRRHEEEMRQRKQKEAEDKVEALQKQKKELEEQLAQAQKDLEAMKKDLESLQQSGEKTIEELQMRVKKLEDDNTKKDETLRDQDADKKTEEIWGEMVGKQYRAEDAETIKPIIRKTVLNQPLTAEELKTVTSKSVSSRITLGGGSDGDGGTAPSEAQEAALVKTFGIRPKVNSKFVAQTK